MRILQLINRVPYPLNDGGSIGINYYMEGFLNAGVKLSVLAMNTTRHWVDVNKLPEVYSRLEHFITVKVDNRIKVLPAFLNLFSTGSYNIDRFVSKEFEEELVRLLKSNEFDIVQLESLYVAPYIPTIRAHSKARVVIRQHNVEFKIWERLASEAKNPLKKAYLTFLAKRLRQFEEKMLNEYDLLLPISERDAQVLKQLGLAKPFFVHPFGINISDLKRPAYTAGTEVSLYHIGAMDWMPNVEAMRYFLEEVMPLIHERLPNLKFYMAGRRMPAYFLENSWKNVVVVGEVENATDFEKDKSILVVPLLSGGGVRIKIYKAMAEGKAIVTTPVGVEGIEASDGKEVMLAKNPEEFARKVEELVAHPEKIEKLGMAARSLIESHYDQGKLITLLLERYAQILTSPQDDK